MIFKFDDYKKDDRNILIYFIIQINYILILAILKCNQSCPPEMKISNDKIFCKNKFLIFYR